MQFLTSAGTVNIIVLMSSLAIARLTTAGEVVRKAPVSRQVGGHDQSHAQLGSPKLFRLCRVTSLALAVAVWIV